MMVSGRCRYARNQANVRVYCVPIKRPRDASIQPHHHHQDSYREHHPSIQYTHTHTHLTYKHTSKDSGLGFDDDCGDAAHTQRRYTRQVQIPEKARLLVEITFGNHVPPNNRLTQKPLSPYRSQQQTPGQTKGKLMAATTKPAQTDWAYILCPGPTAFCAYNKQIHTERKRDTRELQQQTMAQKCELVCVFCCCCSLGVKLFSVSIQQSARGVYQRFSQARGDSRRRNRGGMHHV